MQSFCFLKAVGYIIGFVSGLDLATNSWSIIALVPEPPKASIFVNGLVGQITGTHQKEAFDATMEIGFYDFLQKLTIFFF
jgi:hypothetical protein